VKVKGAVLVLEFFGASLAIVGLNAQKWAADGDSQPKKEDDGGAGAGAGGGTSSSGSGQCGCGWRWLLAISLFVAGQVIQVVAFAFGSQSLVAATSNLSLVTNAVVAHFWFHEPFHPWPRPAATRGVGLLALFVGWDLGTVALVVSGTIVTGVYTTPPPPTDPSVAELRAAVPRVPRALALRGPRAVTLAAVKFMFAAVALMRQRGAGAGAGAARALAPLAP
jgi:hypothetical protein